MVKRIRSRVGRALAAWVGPHLGRSLEQDRERIVLVPVVSPQCMAHHFILESLVRGASQNGTGSDLMKELGQAIERCHFELCAKDAQVAAGIIEDLMDQIRRSAAIADDATS